MEALLGLLHAAALWRLVLGAVVGGVGSAIVLFAFPAAGAAAVFFGVFVGASAGVVWLAYASRVPSSGAAPQPPASTTQSWFSRFLVFGVVWMLGILWGTLFESVFGLVASAILLAAFTPALAWLSFRLSGRRVSLLAQVAAVAALWLGLATPHLSQWSVGGQASNPSIERTSSGKLRLPAAAAHVER
jgi:hypothetical protein